MSQRTKRLVIFGQPIDFIDCADLAEGFRSILRGWTIREVAFDAARPAYMTFEKRSYGYHWDAPWIADKDRRTENPSVTVMDAVCDFHYEFIDWFVDRHPRYFCLHTAGVAFGDGVVLFPCTQKAGKSMLSMQLALLGHRVLGDDVIALTPDGTRASALGLLPRVRLPLPEAVITPELGRFITGHAGPSDRHFQYVDLPGGQIAALGESLPVAGVVLLERGAPETRLEEIPKSAAIKALIDQNFGRLDDPDAIFDRLRDLALTSQSFLLRYTTPLEGARALEAQFPGGRSG